MSSRFTPLGLRMSPLRRLSGPSTPPAAPKQGRPPRFRLWSAPNAPLLPLGALRSCSLSAVTLTPRSQSPVIPPRPPMPEFPAEAFPELRQLRGLFPASRREHSACPKQTGQSFGQGALPAHHIPPTLKILSPRILFSPNFLPIPPLPTMSTCSRLSKAATLLQHPSDRSRRAPAPTVLIPTVVLDLPSVLGPLPAETLWTILSCPTQLASLQLPYALFSPPSHLLNLHNPP
ncbi:hypothetical protein PGT21_019015 [Puccinia graminis f. sp. tritici]|uniref:Uncharacterized protein n=1 Tax=Puccinia graminis f. sp. tritici TaxID=56615 RepID=A0A5B0PSL3_PUCGR|nr:hypothetical protein PGT21_019015 [Puccinia graminis f. sp. tritici]